MSPQNQYHTLVLSADALDISQKHSKHTIDMWFRREVRYRSTKYEVPIPTSGGMCSVYISEGDIIGKGQGTE